MLAVTSVRRVAAGAAVLVSVVMGGGCTEDTGTGPVSTIETMRLTVGSQSVTVSSSGVCTGCPLVLSNGATVTAVFLTDRSIPDPVVSPGSRYRLVLTIPQNSAGLQFTLNPSNSFAGTFSATGTLSAPIDVLFNLHDFSDDSEEFGPLPVSVTVAGSQP